MSTDKQSVVFSADMRLKKSVKEKRGCFQLDFLYYCSISFFCCCNVYAFSKLVPYGSHVIFSGSIGIHITVSLFGSVWLPMVIRVVDLHYPPRLCHMFHCLVLRPLVAQCALSGVSDSYELTLVCMFFC